METCVAVTGWPFQRNKDTLKTLQSDQGLQIFQFIGSNLCVKCKTTWQQSTRLNSLANVQQPPRSNFPMHGWPNGRVAAWQTQRFAGNYKRIKVRSEMHRRFYVRLRIIASCCCSLFVESNFRMSCSCVDDVMRESYNGTSLVADRVWWYHQRSKAMWRINQAIKSMRRKRISSEAQLRAGC